VNIDKNGEGNYEVEIRNFIGEKIQLSGNVRILMFVWLIVS
jgi:hypothetical protein